jgi:DNA polymerase III sliding clamp (beta) subunit (PCNA family)
MVVKFNAKELKDVLTLVNMMENSGFGVSDIVYFNFSGGSVRIFGTNGVTEVSAEISCSVEGEVCNLAFNKWRMLDLVRGLGKQSSVVVEVDGENVVIKSGNDVFRLKLEEPAEKDSFIIHDSLEMHRFNAKIFAKALEHVMYASMAKSDGNPNVVFIKDGKIFYGCDGYRLARYVDRDLVFFGLVPDELMISVSDAKLLVNAVNLAKEDYGIIGFVDGVMVVEVGKYRIGLNCQNYSFPAFELILAGEWESVAAINIKDFLGALRHVKKVGKEKYVEVEVAGNKMKLSVKNNYGDDVGVSREIDVELRQGNGFKKSFTIQYLIDALKLVEKEKVVELYCPSESEQIACIDIFNESKEYRAMVMEVVLM